MRPTCTTSNGVAEHPVNTSTDCFIVCVLTLDHLFILIRRLTKFSVARLTFLPYYFLTMRFMRTNAHNRFGHAPCSVLMSEWSEYWFIAITSISRLFNEGRKKVSNLLVLLIFDFCARSLEATRGCERCICVDSINPNYSYETQFGRMSLRCKYIKPYF
jgi:hypothetical protein